MGVYVRSALLGLVAGGFCQSAMAMVEDDTSVAGVSILTVDDNDDLVEVELKIEGWLDAGRRVALTGTSSMLDVLKPDRVYAWPTTNTIVLDPGAGLGIFGFDAADTSQRAQMLRAWPWVEQEDVGLRGREVRSVDTTTRIYDVAFNLSAPSPSSICRTYRRKLARTLFSDRVPGADEVRAFDKQLRRWCQYGDLSVHAASSPQFTISPFLATDEPRLSLVAEWALLRNDDPLDPAGTTFFFWAETVGDGAGSGFGRLEGTDGYIDAIAGGVRRLLDASVHSGWGPVRYDNGSSAWPLDSSFPGTAKTGLFLCDMSGGQQLAGCPQQPRLRSLYPADSIDGLVIVSQGEQFLVGGMAQFGASPGADPAVSFNLNVVKGTANTAQSEMHLLQTHSNADTVFHRTTRWTPDLPAMYRWINARNHNGSLAHATPLAATLNPKYAIMWELPLRGNEGRNLSYNMIYEAGWNTCFNGPNCANHTHPPDSTLSAKARVGWRDRVRLTIPYD
jgi:hypothetical protein